MAGDISLDLIQDVILALCMQRIVTWIKESGDCSYVIQFIEYYRTWHSKAIRKILNAEHHKFCCPFFLAHILSISANLIIIMEINNMIHFTLPCVPPGLSNLWSANLQLKTIWGCALWMLDNECFKALPLAWFNWRRMPIPLTISVLNRTGWYWGGGG